MSLSACGLLTSRARPKEVLQIGAVGLFPADRRNYRGELPEDALRAAVGRLNALGGILGLQVAYRGAHAGTEDEAFEGFQRFLSDPTVIGVVLATPLGADRIADEAARRGMPLVSATVDFTAAGALYPDDPNRETLFQFAIPADWSLQVLFEYCRHDRGYKEVGVLFDEISYPRVGAAAPRIAESVGLRVVWLEEFGRGGRSLSEQLRSANLAAPQALVVWGDPETAAKTALALEELGASYQSSIAARGSSSREWHPHLMGSPAAMGERDWASVAQAAARPGSVSVGDIGGFRKGSEWLPELWGRDHVVGWERDDKARRGLRAIVDAAYVLFEAARRSGRGDRDGVLNALEQSDRYQFASTPFELGGRKRVALEQDDLCLMVLEEGKPAPAVPPYELGREWQEGTMADRDMTVLLRPRLEANLRRAPEMVGAMLRGGYGTQCTKEGEGRLTPACSVH
jgi:ABC-type branched-subunit amino acid transport system substrate-binding protein